MSSVAASKMTTEQLLALPDDGVERSLVRGALREVRPDLPEGPMTMRNRRHSRIEARVAQALTNWLDQQAAPRGEVVVGEAGFRLSLDPNSSVGIDVAYVSAELAAQTPAAAAFFEGPPVLAVEVLSPADKQQDIDDKVALYLETGVRLVWVLNPRFGTVCVHRPDAEPELFNVRQELTAEPHLPGFRAPVAKLFEA